MIFLAASQAQRNRRLLNQEAMKRSHRRSELSRLTAQEAAHAPLPEQPAGDESPNSPQSAFADARLSE